MYLRQFITPLICSVAMAMMMLIAKGALNDSVSAILTLMLCTSIGVATYALSIRLVAPSLFQKLIEMARLLLLDRNRKNA
jgi:hypothetical protein